MTISDIITILSLVIAIIAIISEKQRKHLLLKYGWIDIFFYGLIFISINYFVFYKEFYGKGVYLDFLYLRFWFKAAIKAPPLTFFVALNYLNLCKIVE